jgi:hypothetical protein
MWFLGQPWVARGICFNGHPGKSLMKHGFFWVSTIFQQTNPGCFAILGAYPEVEMQNDMQQLQQAWFV